MATGVKYKRPSADVPKCVDAVCFFAQLQHREDNNEVKHTE